MKYIVTTLFMCAMVAVSASAQTETTETNDNLLVNGDFEGDDHSAWTLKPNEKDKNTATIATSNGVGGSASAKLGVANKQLVASFEQGLTLEQGSKYDFSGVCYYAAALTNGKVAKIQILSADDRTVKQEVDIPTEKIYNPTNAGSLTEEKAKKDLTVTFDIDPEISGNVLLSFTNNGIDKLIRFDNLSVTKKSSEPGTETGIADVTVDKIGVRAMNGNIVISGEGLAEVAVYSVNGQLVRTVNMNGAEEVVVEGLPKGVYIVGSSKVIL